MARGGTVGYPDRIRPVLSYRAGRGNTGAWRGFGDAWTALSTLLTGMVVWGGAGYGLDRLFGTRPVLFVIGVLVGHFGGIYLVYVRAMRMSDNAGVAPRGRVARPPAFGNRHPPQLPSKQGGGDHLAS